MTRAGMAITIVYWTLVLVEVAGVLFLLAVANMMASTPGGDLIHSSDHGLVAGFFISVLCLYGIHFSSRMALKLVLFLIVVLSLGIWWIIVGFDLLALLVVPAAISCFAIFFRFRGN